MAARTTDKLRHKDLIAAIARLRAAGQTGSFADGGGLALMVTKAGKARFVHKFQHRGRTAERWLPGSFPDEIGLAEAREMRDADRKLLRDGKDPIAVAKAATTAAVTFADYAIAHMDFLAPNRANARAVWLRQMTGRDTKGVTVGRLATMSIDAITLEHVKAVVLPLWRTKPATAKELLGRIRRVLDHRQVNHRPDDERANPADFQRMERAIGRRYEHRHKPRAALDYTEVPAFMARLAERPQLSARVLEMVVLTGCRVAAITGLRWHEVDLAARTVTIPAARVKGQHDVDGEAHVVPLSLAMLRCLRRALPPGGQPHPSALVFPNSKGRAYDHRDVLEHVKLLAADQSVTTHGFRSAIVGWGSAMPHRAHPPFDRDLMDVVLGHRLGNEVSQSYLRDRWLERRRLVMREWSNFCRRPAVANVAPLRRAA